MMYFPHSTVVYILRHHFGIMRRALWGVIACTYRGDFWNWLNLITAPGPVSNQPGSITWLATKYFKTVSWRNYTKKLTLWPQNWSFWPKINIPSSYYTILMLNCLENTFKLQFWQLCDSCQIPDLINFQNNLTWPNSNTAGISLDSRLKYRKITHRCAKKPLQSLGSCTKNFPYKIDFIHFICQFHQSCGINVRERFCFMDEPAAPQHGMLGGHQTIKAPSMPCWGASDYNEQWQRALCIVALLKSSQPNKQRNKKRKCML